MWIFLALAGFAFAMAFGFGIMEPPEGVTRYTASTDALTLGLLWLVLATMHRDS